MVIGDEQHASIVDRKPDPDVEHVYTVKKACKHNINTQYLT